MLPARRPASPRTAPRSPLCPAQRSAMALRARRRATATSVLRRGCVGAALEARASTSCCGRDGDEAVDAHRARGELRFAPGGELADLRGRRWSVDGELGVLERRERPGRRVRVATSTRTRSARAWSALTCPNAGDVLLSAAPGYEFVDWGGADHVGGGSHGSLHRADSLGRAAVVRHRPGLPRRARHNGRCATLRRWCASTSGSRRSGPTSAATLARCLSDEASHRRAPASALHARPAGLRRPPTGCSSCASAWSAPAATSSTWPCSRAVRAPCSASTTASSATVAFLVAVTNNFWWNRHWTFEAPRRARRLPGRALLRRQLVAFLFSLSLLELLVAVAGLPKVPAQADRDRRWPRPLNFLGNRLWSFSDRAEALLRPCAAARSLRGGGRGAGARAAQHRPGSALDATPTRSARRRAAEPAAEHRVLTGDKAIAIAKRMPEGRATPSATTRARTATRYLKGADRWQVSLLRPARAGTRRSRR